MKKTKDFGQQLLSKIEVPSVDEQFFGLTGDETDAPASEIALKDIDAFKNHPFRVVDDEKMDDLVESIRANGILTPVLVRPARRGRYELISGHRRVHAAQRVGLRTVPAVIRDLDDDAATIFMVDANLQREELLPSEKAFAYKMKLDAIKHQGKATSAQNVQKQVSADIIAQEVGGSRELVRRYIRLTYLMPELLALVDEKRVPFTAAVDMSYLNADVQAVLLDYLRQGRRVKPAVLAELRHMDKEGTLTAEAAAQLLQPQQTVLEPVTHLTLSGAKLYKYFPADYTVPQMQKVIESLLKQWAAEQKK